MADKSRMDNYSVIKGLVKVLLKYGDCLDLRKR